MGRRFRTCIPIATAELGSSAGTSPGSMKSELLPKRARLIGLASLVFLAAIFGLLVSQDVFFRWFVVLLALWPLYMLVRAPHSIFSLDADTIAWCKDMKRHPVTRIPIGGIQEVHLVTTDENNDGGDIYKVVIVDSIGGTHEVETGDCRVTEVYRALQTYCPRASFRKIPFAMRNLLRGTPARTKRDSQPPSAQC
jgi:hypothetical protein